MNIYELYGKFVYDISNDIKNRPKVCMTAIRYNGQNMTLDLFLTCIICHIPFRVYNQAYFDTS